MRTLLAILFLTISISCYSQEQDAFEYLTMTQIENVIKLCKNSESFETVKVKDEKSNDRYDFRPLLKRIQAFEKQGWEVVSNTVYTTSPGAFPENYVMMRRKP